MTSVQYSGLHKVTSVQYSGFRVPYVPVNIYQPAFLVALVLVVSDLCCCTERASVAIVHPS